MKKLALVFAAVSMLLVSCGKIDTSKWLDSLEAGKKAAQKENKEILVFFSTNEDGYSQSLREGLFASPEFLAEQTKKYVLVNLDFSAERFQSSLTTDDMSKSEQKAAAKVKESLERDMKWTYFFNLEMTPNFFVISRDGYVLSKLDFVDEELTLEGFNAMIEAKADKIKAKEDIIAKIKSTKGLEKVKAVEELFNETDPGHRDLLAPLFEEAIKLDENNESGVIGTFLLSLANSKAIQLYLDDEADIIYEPFEKVSENALLSASEKQQALYMAGYLLASSGSTDFVKIKDFFQRAIDANPDDEHATYLKNWIGQIDERMAEMEAAEAEALSQAEKGAGAADAAGASGSEGKSSAETSSFEVIQ